MRGKKIIAKLNKYSMAQVDGLYQWDYGQRLILRGVSLPFSYEVHFSNESIGGKSFLAVGDDTGVRIPDEVLTTGKDVFFWVFLHEDEESGETEYDGRIHVTARSKPTDIQPTPRQQNVITETIAALDAGVETVQNIADGIGLAIETALQEAKDSGEFDGFSPIATVTKEDRTATISITDVNGTTSAEIFSPIANVTKDGNTVTITITDEDGTTSETVDTSEIDDTAGLGDTDKTWSANKLTSEFNQKADLINPEFSGHIILGNGTATGQNSLAIGTDSWASGDNSLANGNHAIAHGYSSHSEGDYTEATGYAGHAEGYHTLATGFAGHAEGDYTTAEGRGSHAEGFHTTASAPYMHSSGEYNIDPASGIEPWNKNTTYFTGDRVSYGIYGAIAVFESLQDNNTNHTPISPLYWSLITERDYGVLETVGNGTAENARSNARMLDWDGNEYLAGDIYVNCNPDGTGGTKLTPGVIPVIPEFIYDIDEGYSCNMSFSDIYSAIEDHKCTYASDSDRIAPLAAYDSLEIVFRNTIVVTSVEFSGTETISYAINSNDQVNVSTYYNSPDSSITANVEQNASRHDYSIGDLFMLLTSSNPYETHLYKATSVIAYGDTITPNTNCVQTTIANELNTLTNDKADKTDTVLNTTLSRGRKYNTTVGEASFAFGTNVASSGANSHAEGDNTSSNGSASHSEGKDTTATGNYSHAEGRQTLSAGANSHSEGYVTVSTGDNSHSEGYHSDAIGEDSHAEGYDTRAEGDYSHSEGGQTLSYGSYSHAEGGNTSAYGICSHAEGSGTNAGENCAHAEGLSTSASAVNAHSEGMSTTASGSQSHAEGVGSTASGDNSHAEGAGTMASGLQSHSEGGGTTASGAQSHAEGASTTASGANSHSEGATTIASGLQSHAEGEYTIASGRAAHAEGSNTTATGTNSHVSGMYNVADSYDNWDEWAANTSYEVGDKVKITTTANNETTVNGYICNTANNDGTFIASKWDDQLGKMNYAEIIGNGTNDNARSNARTLDWKGNEWVAGKVSVGNIVPTSANDLTTKSYVDDLVSHIEQMHIHICVSGEYDAQGVPTIQNPDPNTFYLVPGGETPNLYVEWVYVNNSWEQFGSATIEVPVQDVQINGTTIVANSIASIPNANASTLGVVKAATNDSTTTGIRVDGSGLLETVPANDTDLKTSASVRRPITPNKQDASAFYGLAKAAGDTTQALSDNAVGTYTDTAATAIRTMIGAEDLIKVQDAQPTSTATKIWIPVTPENAVQVPTVQEMNTALAGKVSDVQVNGTSVVTNNVASIPVSAVDTLGVVKLRSSGQDGLIFSGSDNGRLMVAASTDAQAKAGANGYNPIVPSKQHMAVYYGLSKLAGVDLASETVTVGTYPATSQTAIKTMLGVQDGLEVVELI